MLSAWRQALLIGVGLSLLACSDDKLSSPPSAPLATEATYKLTFNDMLVGTALFIVESNNEGHYKIETLTVPAGQMSNIAENEEVLEISEGELAADAVKPNRFHYSVMRDGMINAVDVAFDWDKARMNIRSGDASSSAGLSNDTQDQLSYLLVARQLAMRGHGGVELKIASLDSTEDTRLEIIGRKKITVPLGDLDAVGIRRVGSDPAVDRELWFELSTSALPLRITQQWEGNAIEMVLESLSPTPSDPH